ncbi:MAG TPA: hypothetical protein VGB27_14510, partial [Candidatus Binatia bacterium]
ITWALPFTLSDICAIGGLLPFKKMNGVQAAFYSAIKGEKSIIQRFFNSLYLPKFTWWLSAWVPP